MVAKLPTITLVNRFPKTDYLTTIQQCFGLHYLIKTIPMTLLQGYPLVQTLQPLT